LSVLNGKAVFGVGQPTAGGGGTTQSVASTSNVATGEWVHVAATRDQLTGTIKVFVNGQENGTLNTGFRNALNGQEHIRLGGSTENETSYFDGQIDEVRIFDEVLTAEQIQANYNQGLSFPALSLTW